MARPILDSHIHLWPASAANATSHQWMQPGHILTKQYSGNDYVLATSKRRDHFDVKGFIFVETDARVDDSKADVRGWAEEPLKEIAFLRRLVEGDISLGEGFQADQSSLLRGIVAWAPLDRPLHDFLQYMAAAKEVAGKETWNKIKGFRYLVQGITDEEKFRALVNGGSNSAFVTLLKFLGSRGLVFDVGVDQRQGGVWQLERFAEAIELTHANVVGKDKTVFILNHLCKPDMQQPTTENEQTTAHFERWKAAISRMARQERVYVKLSGAFSEIKDQTAEQPMPVQEIVERMRPWLDHIFTEFGPWRIMFGSDWPVCNVRGPGDENSWGHWADVVDAIMQSRGLSEMEMDRIWHGTAVEAYKLDPVS